MVHKIANQSGAPLGVHHLGVKLHAVELAGMVGDGGAGGVVSMGQQLKAIGQARHRVPVAHPHGGGVVHIGEQVGGVVDEEGSLTVFAPLGAIHLAAELLHHQLHAVAYPQHWNTQLPNGWIAVGRAGVVHRLRPTRKNNALGVELFQLLGGGAVGEYLRVHLGLADPAGNQLGVLRAKV